MFGLKCSVLLDVFSRRVSNPPPSSRQVYGRSDIDDYIRTHHCRIRQMLTDLGKSH